MTIRTCTQDDLRWLLEMCLKHYEKKIKNPAAVDTWLRDTIGAPGIIFLRNDRAFVLAQYERSFYDSAMRGDIQLFAGDAIQVARLMLYLKEVGQENSIEWEFRSTTGKDIRKLAKILGAVEASPTFRLEISHV